jgi:hypothetical protein
MHLSDCVLECSTQIEQLVLGDQGSAARFVDGGPTRVFTVILNRPGIASARREPQKQMSRPTSRGFSLEQKWVTTPKPFSLVILRQDCSYEAISALAMWSSTGDWVPARTLKIEPMNHEGSNMSD